MVLDRECPQCHISYATNFLYNTHPCAVKTKRCAGCNRLQRNEIEYVKHSALCAKVYLNYSKHIAPIVEAQEDAVRIKNENEVEAAAEEMARLTGLPLDLSPVVHLTRLSSPLIMAVNQCVSIPGLDDSPTTTAKKSGKKGVSKKELKRVDELLKSTLDALVSIKHEPEVHVEPETQSAADGEASDNEPSEADYNMEHGFQDDYHHNDDSDQDGEEEPNNKCVHENQTPVMMIKLETDENMDVSDAANKTPGFGLKLKIRKEHGQLNSSIIEQEAVDKKAEKRKKKKKHKDKEKDKQKAQQKEHPEEPNPMESFNIPNNESTVQVQIKTEPLEAMDTTEEPLANSQTQNRPQPEATIMTSIPMMQLQIACISEGVEFNGANTSVGEVATDDQANGLPTNHHSIDQDQEDVKPNREELDRIMNISHVSSGIEQCAPPSLQISSVTSGIAMETNEAEPETAMEHDQEDGAVDGEGQITRENEPDNQMPMSSPLKQRIEYQKSSEKNPKVMNTKLIQQKEISKQSASPVFAATTPTVKSRNKACKSTAKPSNVTAPPLLALQISAVQSGIVLPTAPVPTPELDQNDFVPMFIKPEPQNRGYSDEVPATSSPSHSQSDSHSASPSPSHSLSPTPNHEPDEIPPSQRFTAEEQAYISSIDFNNITIKQEKDLDINDIHVTTTKKTRARKSYSVNGIKKRKTNKEADDDDNLEDTYGDKDETLHDEDANADTEDDDDREEYEQEEDGEEEDEEEEEEEEYEEDDLDEEEEEEREYRELEYPPELGEEPQDNEQDEEDATEESETEANVNAEQGVHVEKEEEEQEEDEENKSSNTQDTASNDNVTSENEENSSDRHHDDEKIGQAKDNRVECRAPADQTPALLISSVCSNASDLMPPTGIPQKSVNLNVNTNTLIKVEHDITTMSPTQSQDNHILLPNDLNATDYHRESLRYSEELQQTPVLKISSVASGSLKLRSQHQILNTNPISNSENIYSLVVETPIKEVSTPGETVDMGLRISDVLSQTAFASQAMSCSTNQIITSGDVNAESQRSEGLFYPVATLANLCARAVTSGEKVVTETGIVHSQGGSEGFVVDSISKLAVMTNSENTKSCSLSQSGSTHSDLNVDPCKTEIVTKHNCTQAQSLENPTVTDYSQSEANPMEVTSAGDEQSAIFSGQCNTVAITDYPNVFMRRNVDPNLHPDTGIISNQYTEQIASISALPDFCPNENVEKECDTNIGTMSGVIKQADEMKLQARPFVGSQESGNCYASSSEAVPNDNEEYDESYVDGDAAEEAEEDDETPESEENSNLNLEEQQNQRNQEQQFSSRPTALALHPYLEDISSSSNSFLSNTLSQTPPPPAPAAVASHSSTQHHTENNEETDNILNESNDIMNRHHRPSLASQPPSVPFNFDNINEIAENNNNANIEREQLQDDQHHQQQRQQQDQQPNDVT